jgi:hypothetical protein
MVLAAMTLFLISGALAFAHDVTVTLNEQNGSGQNGTAVLTDMGDGTTKVTVSVSNGSATAQPAHIHAGTCATLDPKPAYPLSNVVNGMSETIVPVDVHDLTGGTFAINLHKSAAEASVYTSCGNIVAASHEAGMPRTGVGENSLALAGLCLLALVMLSVGFRLARKVN